MEQVTCDGVEEVKVTELQNELEFDDQTAKIFKEVHLDSKSTVFAGLFLLELYYNKTYNKPLDSKYINEPNPIDIFVFGSEETIISTVYKIIEQLQQIKDFGPMKIYNCYAIKQYLKITWKQHLRPVTIVCSNCKNPLELLQFFESGNEMIYWAHDTGLVVSPYSKIGMKTNQVVPNFNNSIISNQQLLFLKVIGFDISDYAKSISFIKRVDVNCIFASASKFRQPDFFNYDLSKLTLNYYLFSIEHVKKKPFTSIDQELNLSLSNESIIKPANKPHSENTFIITGIFKQLIKIDFRIIIILIIPDDDTAKLIKKIVSLCHDIKDIQQTCILDSNYLKPEEKYLAKPGNKIFNQLVCDFSNENNLVIACEISTNLKIIDSIGKSVLYSWPGYGSDTIPQLIDIINAIPTNTKLNIWFHFGIGFRRDLDCEKNYVYNLVDLIAL